MRRARAQRTSDEVDFFAMARKNRVTGSPANARPLWRGAAFVGLFAALALWQGGYYAASTCIVGMLAAGCCLLSIIAAARVRSKGRNGGGVCISTPLLFAGVGACSLVSSVVQRVSLTGLAESASWFSVASLAFLYASMSDGERAKTMRAVTWVGVACAALGLVLISGSDAVAGAVNAGRLQFPFQYANAAGAWYAACAVLALGSESARLRGAAVFPLAALAFTQSAGAGMLLACAFAVLCVRWWRAGAFARVTEAMLLAAGASGAFALCSVVGLNGAFACTVVACVICFPAMGKLEKAKNPKRAAIIACALLAASALVCLGALAQSGRVAQAGRTFVERLVQMVDATGVLAANPLFGIGPDAWRFLYPYVQSAQYTATSVHCGYAQIALDAGLAGLALFVVSVVLGIKRSTASADVPVACATLIIALHGAIDIDFQFSALLGFLAMLLIGRHAPKVPTEARETVSARLRGRCGLRGCSAARIRVVAASVLAAAMVANGVGSWAASVKDGCASAAKAGDANAIRRVLEDNPLAAHDDSVRSYYGEALWRACTWSELAHAFDEDSISSADQALYVAEALYALGGDAEAESLLLSELEREPGNVDLFARARFLLATHDASEEAQERYRSAAIHANALASEGLASLIGNQEQLPQTLF